MWGRRAAFEWLGFLCYIPLDSNLGELSIKNEIVQKAISSNMLSLEMFGSLD